MSMRYEAGVLSASYFPLDVPDAPTSVTATVVDFQTVSVAFTAPVNVGGAAVTSYTVYSSGGQIATGSSSPISVTGLTAGTSYTFTVVANNLYGAGPASAASNAAVPVTASQQAYTTAGSYSWVAPVGVFSVSVVCVGGGGGGGSYTNGTAIGGTGGGGGALAYSNNLAVVPGNSYTVIVGAGGTGGVDNSGNNATAGANSTFTAGSTVTGTGGAKGNQSSYYPAGGGHRAQGGMGAGGYGTSPTSASETAGTGGGGGSGGDGTGGGAGGGGGVGILGQGANGTAGSRSSYGTGGGGGSGGSSGATGTYSPAGNGGGYGGGGGANMYNGTTAGNGASGAVRIIWPGTTRQFPSTNTGNL